MMHAYKQDGSPMHWVPNVSKGGTRATRVSDMKKHGAVPSVTEIIKSAHAPGLVNWLQREPLRYLHANWDEFFYWDKAKFAYPYSDPEELCTAVIKASTEKIADDTADIGTRLHDGMELWAKGKPVTAEIQPYVDSFRRIMETDFHLVMHPAPTWKAEHTFSNGRWGGMLDLWCPQGNYPGGGEHKLFDWKSKDFTQEEMNAPRFRLHYDDHAEQLAAYAEGLGLTTYRAFNVFLSRTEPGTVHVVEWEKGELDLGLERFLGLFKYWCAKKRYWPGGEHDQAD